MELVALIVVVAVIMWWLGFARSARKVAEMATSEVDYLAVSHKASVVKRAAEIKISSAQASQAAANVALVNSFDIFAVAPVAAVKAEEVQS